MRLDHFSYVTSHEQLADTVQRIGSLMSTTFVDGGIHPRFGTRNFTAPLLGGMYIEVVCPLDHPATEQTPWGRAVAKKVQEGGGWLTWVFSTENISIVEDRFGRKSVEGHRTRPDGTDLKWKQIGVKEIQESREFPFFIQWLTTDHPSKDGSAVASVESVVINDADQLADSWFKDEIVNSLKDVEINWAEMSTDDNEKGIVGLVVKTPKGVVLID